MSVRPAWLRLTHEEALEPELPIIDTHHHFWENGLGGRYLLEDLLDDLAGGHNVVATVFMECRSGYRSDGPEALKPVGETEFVEGLARAASARASATGKAAPAVAAGIVSHADLMLGDKVRPVLEAHREASPRFRGIRYWTTWDENPEEVQIRQVAPPGLLYDSTFRAGFACLAKMGLVYDAWMLFPQLGDAADLARAFPDATIVIGHVGGLLGVGRYSRRDEVLAQWKKRIDEVAACPNVVMKLGGVGMDRLGFRWTERERPASSIELAQAFAPYCLHCIERFGPGRCMFESNFPVDRRSASYNVLWNAFKRITENFAPAERAALFHDTAARVYRIDA